MIQQLSDEQLATFDTEYVNEARWTIVNTMIQQSFPSGEFTFLDVGGGNGRFTDRILNAYPNAEGSVLDNSALLLERNRSHSRKTLIHASVEDLANHSQHYDIVFINWVLHHLVSQSYAQSRSNIVSTLNIVASLLSERGKISIFENMYDGLIIDSLPSYLIFHLTNSKAIAPLIRKLGANTAGIGVCFLPQKQWTSVFRQSCLHLLNYTDDPSDWHVPLQHRLFLHLGYIRVGHFWLAPETISRIEA